MVYVVENFFKSIDFSSLEISKFMIVILLVDCFYSIRTPEDGILTSLACSAGGFGGFHLSSVKPPLWIRWRLGELGREYESVGGGGGRRRKNKPLPLPQFFFLPPTGLVNFLPRPNSPLFF